VRLFASVPIPEKMVHVVWVTWIWLGYGRNTDTCALIALYCYWLGGL